MMKKIIPIQSIVVVAVATLVSACDIMQTHCQPISEISVAPEVGLSGGTITSIKGTVTEKFQEVKGPDACVLKKLQEGILNDYNKATAGKMPWSEYNRNRKEALSLIKDLEAATKQPGGKVGKHAGPDEATALANIKGYNQKMRY